MSFWDFCAPFYDFVERRNYKAYNGMLSAVRGFVPMGASVLECAAGTGAISLFCADKASNIMCTDFSEKMLNVARRKAERDNVSNISFEKADICNLFAENDSYDIVIAAQVLHLLDDPQRAAEELKRVAKSLVIVPLTMIKNLRGFAKFKVGLWRFFGFAPKHNFDGDSYKKFLIEIGLPPSDYIICDGKMPMVVAVYRKGES